MVAAEGVAEVEVAEAVAVAAEVGPGLDLRVERATALWKRHNQ